MMSYGQLFLTLLPVFGVIALGVFLRRKELINQQGEDALFNVIVKVAMPCLIFESVSLNPALKQAGNVVLPPLLGFGLTLLSMAIAWHVAKALGLTLGHGLRTFALTVGLTNYGYLPLPLMDALFGPESRAVLLLHNAGVEAAIWTGGVLVVTGLSPTKGWRKLLNVPAIALAIALLTNLTGAGVLVPDFMRVLIHSMAVCAIPLGLLMTGVSFSPHLEDPKALVNPRVVTIAWLLRLAILPWVILLTARYLPIPVELKRVLVVQAAMPSGVISVIVARVYGGQPLVAMQIVLGTTIVGLFTIPLWLKLGLWFVGLTP
jgi:predicted permease